MDNRKEQNELFRSSHLMILYLFSILGILLAGETLLLGWEKWALILILSALIICWSLHIRQSLTADGRLWIYSFLMMASYFFYGAHETSTFDLAIVIGAIIMVYTMTGKKNMITLCQFTFYVTFGYELVHMLYNDNDLDSLTITRSLLHIALVTAVSLVAKTIIDKWGKVMMHSVDEIAALKESTKRLNDFLANISHEIRTPVNAVIGLTGIALSREKDEQIRKDLLAVEEAGKRVGEQISDILDYSEIDMRKLAVSNEDYMLSSLLNDLVTELAPYKRSDIELVIDVDANLPSVLNSDVTKLKKIFWHLILNGLKYTREGGIYVHITSVKRDYGINLCIEVADTGIGMSEVEIERIFDRFYQADSGRTREASGLGLGLTIVNGFVQAMDGFLTIESEPGNGTVVRISIPQKVVDDTDCMTVDNPEKLNLGAYLHFEKFNNPHVRVFYNSMVKNIVKGLRVTMHRVDNLDGLKKLSAGMKFTHLFVGKEEYEEDPEFFEAIASDTLVEIVADDDFVLPASSAARIMRKPFFCFPVIAVLGTNPHEEVREEGRLYCKDVRALVVDDEPMNLTVAMGVFREYGMTVETAVSGTEAIEMCRAREYDIVFMDHMMPGMDGVEAMKRIRSEWGRDKNRSYDTPIVALTANTVSTAKEMFLREGFDGFIGKPIEIAEMERVLKKVLPKSVFVDKADVRGRAPVSRTPVSGVNEGDSYTGTQSEPTSGADYRGQLARLGIDADKGLIYCQDDADFYKTLLLQYAGEASQKISNAAKFREEGNLEDYATVLHALKSTSKMVGAGELSDKARELELAAKAGDTSVIDRLHDETMEEYGHVSDGIKEIIGNSESTKPDAESVMSETAPDSGVFEFAPKGGTE